MKMYDLRKDEEKVGVDIKKEKIEENRVEPKVSGPVIIFSSKDIPELDDYELGERIELNIVCEVKEIEKPEIDEKKEKLEEPKKTTLEIISAGVTNIKEERKEAERKNITVREQKELQKKRGFAVPSSI